MSADFTPKKEDYGVLSPFKMQVLTNFPYIEADFDALTNYQLLCKVVEYLNNVITNENEVTEQVTSLYNAYVALQNYVNTYFDNLNLQTEVNTKIDEMAEDGTLTNIIKAYIDPLYQAYELEINGIISNQNQTIANQTNNINTFITNSTNDINDISNRVYSVASGSPAGVYSTVSALTTADPDHDKIYVVTADGKWYYYSNSTWTAGGTYQATGEGEDFTELKDDFYGTYTINEHDLLADKTGASLTSLDAQTTITDSDNSPSRQINISNLTGDLSGASLDLGTLFNPFTEGTYYLNFKCRAKRNSASSYQTSNIQVYYFLDNSLKGSLSISISESTGWNEYTKAFSLTTGVNSNINKFVFYANTKYDYEIKDIYITNNTDYNTGYFTQIDGVYKTNYKKISIIGDSITAVNDTASVKYDNLLHNILGYNINNVAVSGSGYFNGSNAGGTNDHQFYNQALRCDNDSDLYLIFGGFNDISRLYAEQVTIGQLGDTGTTTIYGCIYNAINNVYATNPLAKLGIILPAPWQGYNTLMSDDNPYKTYVDNFITALINSCEHYSVKYLDMYHNSSMRPWNSDYRSAYYHDSDGVHPNNAGHAKFLYPAIKSFIKEFIEDKYID